VGWKEAALRGSASVPVPVLLSRESGAPAPVKTQGTQMAPGVPSRSPTQVRGHRHGSSPPARSFLVAVLTDRAGGQSRRTP
jgi:hypothetical protein